MPIMQQLNSLGIDSDDIISLHAIHCKGRLGPGGPPSHCAKHPVGAKALGRILGASARGSSI